MTDHKISTGTPGSFGFSHMSIDLPANDFYKPLTRAQKMKAPPSVTELAPMLLRITNDYSTSTINKAAHMILTDELPYASPHKPAIRWLRDTVSPNGILDPVLNNPTPSLSPSQIHNLYILASSTSSTGWMHSLRYGDLNKLLLSIHSNNPPAEIQFRWMDLADTDLIRPGAAYNWIVTL